MALLLVTGNSLQISGVLNVVKDSLAHLFIIVTKSMGEKKSRLPRHKAFKTQLLIWYTEKVERKTD